jgi:predicted nucleic acid-binding protein
MTPMIMSNIALDTNILIYCHDMVRVDKKDIARNLIMKTPVISAQVVSEYINVLKRLTPVSKDSLIDVCMPVIESCFICPVSAATLISAKKLILRYDFQIFDSIIIASAIEVGCNVLYSEDLHHNLLVNHQLLIVNPFL